MIFKNQTFKIKSTYRLLTKFLGIKESFLAFSSSSKSNGLDTDAVFGLWTQIFQRDFLLCAIYSNICR